MKTEVKGVKPSETITINHAGKKVTTTPAEIWAALTAYRKPVLDDDTIKELLESAIVSGSSYWASELNPLGKYDGRRNLVTQCLERGFYVIDAEAGGKRHEVTPEDIKHACVLLRDLRDYENEPMRRHYFNAVEGNHDAETGDVFLQLCVFKELIYG